jgi:hypothetical protein
MEKFTVSRATTSFGLSLAVCAVVNAVVVILKEKKRGVMAWMQRATGHHWITHSIFLLVLFFLLAGVFASISKGQEGRLSTSRLLAIILSGVAIGCLAIATFYAFID